MIQPDRVSGFVVCDEPATRAQMSLHQLAHVRGRLVRDQTKIDRRDFGITWGHALTGGGFDVAHEVLIDLQMEALQPPPKPAG